MQRFEYTRASACNGALKSAGGGASFLAGGTNLTDYMKLGVALPDRIIDINPLEDDGFHDIVVSDGELRLGALVRMAEAEDHPTIRNDYPVVAQSLALAASRQIRTMASLGGNVLQRTRCEYFREKSWRCNKRAPGSGCDALDGVNREHAVLGTSDHCIAAYPGDFAQALIALDARVETARPGGGREIAFADLHRLPGETPSQETTLAEDELIVRFAVPAGPHTRRSRFVKVRDRESYQFAQASAAIALHLADGVVEDIRIALGGVATVPWRAIEAENVLKGEKLDEARIAAAAKAAFADAVPQRFNAHKIPLGIATVKRALIETSEMQV